MNNIIAMKVVVAWADCCR